MTKPTLPKGIYPQLYRGAMHGTPQEKIKQLEEALDLFKAIGMPGVLMHGFTGELDVAKFKQLEALCDARGLLCIPAFGLDSSNPEIKGQKMGAVVAASKSKILVIDMEGAWEDEKEDKAKAVIMGQEIRKLAPDALIIDQPWPVPTYHWGAFPWEETAAYVDIRAPQYYVNDWASQYGKNRYEKCWAWFEGAWAKLNERLQPKGLVRPVIRTIQGYRWDLEDLIDCLLKNDTMIMWCEWQPTEDTIRAIKAVLKLKELGFTGSDAVKQFQLSTNGKLTADGVCGPKSLAELGV
jgi:hypothetical protein